MAKDLAYHAQGEGPLWVWLHGWGMNKAVWRPTQELFARHHRVITIDLPGFGESSWHPENDSFENAFRRVEETMLTIQTEHAQQKIHLLGWSMGGLFAAALAAKSPEQYSHLVWVASTAKFMEQEDWKGIKPEVLSMFQKQLAKDFRATTERFLAVQAMGSPNARKDISHLKSILAQTEEPNPDALKAGLNWLESVDLRHQFNTLNIPTTRIYGSRDSLVPKQQMHGFNKTNDNSILFEDSAHTPFLNEPERFLKVLSEISN